MSEIEKPKSPAKSWRAVLPLHPAVAGLFPPMPEDELKKLGEKIRRNGMKSPVVLWAERETDVEKMPPPQYYLLDGCDMLDAMEAVGIRVIQQFSGREFGFHSTVLEDLRFGESTPKVNPMTGDTTVERCDPYSYVLSANRRHLTTKQRLDLLDRVTKANPSISSRRVAKLVGVSPTTAANSRRKLEATGEVSAVDTSTDTKGRKQPTHKARRTADRLVRAIMAREAATPGYALAVARGITAKLADFPDMPKHETTAPDAHA